MRLRWHQIHNRERCLYVCVMEMKNALNRSTIANTKLTKGFDTAMFDVRVFFLFVSSSFFLFLLCFFVFVQYSRCCLLLLFVGCRCFRFSDSHSRVVSISIELVCACVCVRVLAVTAGDGDERIVRLWWRRMNFTLPECSRSFEN